MLTAEGSAARRRRLWEALPSPCDLLIVGDPSHLIYFANYVQSPFTFRSNDAGAILLLTPDRSTLVADDMLGPFLDRAHVDEVIAPTWYDGQRSAPPRRAKLVRSVLDALAAIPGRRVGIERAAVPSGVLESLRDARKGLQLVDLDPIIPPLRRSKDADELSLLRRSIRAGEAGHAAALEQIEPGMSELELFRIVQDAAIAAVGEPAIVYGDFDAGPREDGTLAPRSDLRLNAGELFLLDFSVVIGGYRGDFANTMVVGREPSADQRRRFEGCVAALAAGETLLRPGTAARDIDAALRKAFADRGLPDFPTHGGHGVGLGHPEPPFIVPEGADKLQIGDVVTLEPGQYGPGFAMRFERNYLITADGPETLTRHKIALSAR